MLPSWVAVVVVMVDVGEALDLERDDETRSDEEMASAVGDENEEVVTLAGRGGRHRHIATRRG